MNDPAVHIRNFFELNPSHFGVLKVLTITQGDNAVGVYEQRISLVLVRSVDDESDSLHVDFYGVKGICISHAGSSVIQMRLEILEGNDVPGVESLFCVRDAELDRVIRFECRGFEAFKASN